MGGISVCFLRGVRLPGVSRECRLKRDCMWSGGACIHWGADTSLWLAVGVNISAFQCHIMSCHVDKDIKAIPKTQSSLPSAYPPY